MQFHKNELFLLYNPFTSKGKQTKALAKSICNHINEVNVLSERVGPTYWKEVVNMLGLTPKELLDRSHPDYQRMVAGRNITMTGWLDVLMHYPHLLAAPVVIFNGKAVLCNTPTDLFKVGKPAERSVPKLLPHLRSH